MNPCTTVRCFDDEKHGKTFELEIPIPTPKYGGFEVKQHKMKFVINATLKMAQLAQTASFEYNQASKSVDSIGLCACSRSQKRERNTKS